MIFFSSVVGFVPIVGPEHQELVYQVDGTIILLFVIRVINKGIKVFFVRSVDGLTELWRIVKWFNAVPVPSISQKTPNI